MLSAKTLAVLQGGMMTALSLREDPDALVNALTDVAVKAAAYRAALDEFGLSASATIARMDLDASLANLEAEASKHG